MKRTIVIRVAPWAVVILCCALGASSTQTRAAAPGMLKGAFSVLATEQCIHSSGFGPPPVLEALGPTVLESITLAGTLTFNGDGTGEFTGLSSSITTMSIGSPVQQSTLRCPISYSIEPRGVLRLERTCKGTVTRGSLSVGGQVWTSSAVRLEGRLHPRGDSLQLSDTALEAETLTSFHGARTPRLCTRAWNAIAARP